MKRVQKWVYYCDFCRKRSMSASSITRHEASCTLNPNRVCRVCKMTPFVDDGHKQTPMVFLLEVLPTIELVNDQYGADIYPAEDQRAVVAAIPKLREVAGNCPACMLAALRQKKIPVPMATGFDFTEEMKTVWGRVNEVNLATSGEPW